MLLRADDLDLAQGIEAILAGADPDVPGTIKPELMQSVLEIATEPCDTVASAGRQLRDLRAEVADVARREGMLVGAAGTHPFARWEDQLITERQRYKDLAGELRYIARRELIFGIHVHVAIEGAERAIYVADGIRRYLPLLLALSANSPFWRGEETGMRSTRTPIFRAFPRVGIPPHYGSWEIYSHRVNQMMRGGAIPDYSYLWWDVRPHPKLGTVETRVFDQQTHLDDTLALAALTASLARRLVQLYDVGEPLVEQPSELVDDNKVRAAIGGIDADLVDFRQGRQVEAREMAANLMEELAGDAAELGCETELKGLGRILSEGTGAERQLRVWRERPDLRALVRDIAERTVPAGAGASSPS